MRSKNWAFLGIFILITCLLSFSSETQDLQHEVTVTLKLIQIYVTDNAGNPVTDLNKSDFVVYDNKKLREITDFEKYILFPSKDKKELQSKTKETEPSISADETMNRKFFFFFDLANNNFKGFIKSQAAALHFIDNQLQPFDEVGVLSFSVLKGLTLHEYFTKNHQAIRKVVEQMGKEGRVGKAENFQALIWHEVTGEPLLNSSQGGEGIKGGIPEYLKSTPAAFREESSQDWRGAQYKSIAINLLEKLSELSKALRYISGHKHVIFFPPVFPTHSFTEMPAVAWEAGTALTHFLRINMRKPSKN
jgi:VWFA-related protein